MSKLNGQAERRKRKRTIVYARVSTDEQARGYSLSTQLDACRKYAVECGYNVVAEFADDYTGAVLDRPALNQLRDYVKKNSVTTVIVYDIDRLARKAVYQMLLEEELSRRGLTIEYVIGRYEDSDEGRLQKQIRASIAEYEKAKILERMMRGKRGKARSGYVEVGARPPYGYKKVSEPHKTWLEIDEDEARIVRLIYRWYVEGDGESGPLSMNAIAQRLTAMRILTRGDKQKHVAKKRGKGVWQPATVRSILRNETYTGLWHFGKTQMVNDGQTTGFAKDKRGYGKQVARSRKEWVAVPVPAIIDQKAFKQAQERIRLNIEQSQRNNGKYKYLMARRLKCTQCGYSFVGRTRHKKHTYYYCNGKQQIPVKLCDVPAFRADLVDETVWQWVKSLIENPENMIEGLLATKTETEDANQALYERLALIESQLKDAQEQLTKLLDLYLEGEFSKDMLFERKTHLEKTITDLQQEQVDLAAHIETVAVTETQVAEIKSFFANIRQELAQTTFEDKRRIIELLDVRGKLTIENDEKVAYVKCKIGKQRLSVALTSP